MTAPDPPRADTPATAAGRREPNAGPVLFTSAFVALMAAQLLQSLGYASMLLLPMYLEHLGASRAEIGTIMGSAAVGGLAVRPVVAWALDSIGRKPTIVAGTGVLAAGVAAIWLVQDLSWVVYAVRIAIGVGIGVLFTGYFTLAADQVPASRRTEGIAIFGIFGLLGLVVNPVAEAIGVEGGALRGFYPWIALIILGSLVLLARVPEPPPHPTGSHGGWRGVGRALGARRLAPVWVATVVFSSLVATYMAFATVAAASAGSARPALLWGTYTVGAVSVRLFGARVPDRIGPSNLVAPALACYAAAMLATAAAGSEQGFLVAGLLAGLGHGYCFPVLTSQVVTRSPAAVRGAALAMFTGLWELSRLVLTPVFGLVSDRLGDDAMFASAALFACAGLCAWAVLEARFGGPTVQDT